MWWWWFQPSYSYLVFRLKSKPAFSLSEDLRIELACDLSWKKGPLYLEYHRLCISFFVQGLCEPDVRCCMSVSLPLAYLAGRFCEQHAADQCILGVLMLLTSNAQILLLSGVCSTGPFCTTEIAYCVREYLAYVEMERLH